jgi:hypothetical protein
LHDLRDTFATLALSTYADYINEDELAAPKSSPGQVQPRQTRLWR